MQDVFKEQLIKRHTKFKDIALKGMILTLAFILITILSGFLPSIRLIFVALYVFLVYKIVLTLKVEYEYILTNKDLDIDVIYNKSKRKNVFKTNLNDFEAMAHIDQTNNSIFNSATKVKDFSSGTYSENTYVFLIKHENEKTKVIIEPNRDFIDAISKNLPKAKLSIK